MIKNRNKAKREKKYRNWYSVDIKYFTTLAIILYQQL